MKPSFYFDHHIRGEITSGLRRLGVDILTAAEDGQERTSDAVLLERATAFCRVFVSNDSDLLAITHSWLDEGRSFAGLLWFPQQGLSIKQVITELQTIAEASEAEDWIDTVNYLPL